MASVASPNGIPLPQVHRFVAFPLASKDLDGITSMNFVFLAQHNFKTCSICKFYSVLESFHFLHT